MKKHKWKMLWFLATMTERRDSEWFMSFWLMSALAIYCGLSSEEVRWLTLEDLDIERVPDMTMKEFREAMDRRYRLHHPMEDAIDDSRANSSCELADYRVHNILRLCNVPGRGGITQPLAAVLSGLAALLGILLTANMMLSKWSACSFLDRQTCSIFAFVAVSAWISAVILISRTRR